MKSILTLGELFSLNIAKVYGSFLLSLRSHFEEALRESLSRNFKVEDPLEIKYMSLSEMFDIDNMEFVGVDFSSQLEQYNFKIPNRQSSISIIVQGCANAHTPSVLFLKDNDEVSEVHTVKVPTKKILTKEMVFACARWLESGKLSDDFKKEYPHDDSSTIGLSILFHQ